MITIFNRKELLMTSDMQKQGVVRRMLVENGINYAVDVVICGFLLRFPPDAG